MTTSSDDDKAALKVRAWELASQRRMSARAIGAELGISHATANRYVREVESMQDYVDLLDRGEARLAQAVRLDRYIRMLEARVEQGLEVEKVVPILMKVEDRLGKLHRMDDLPAEDDDGNPLFSEQDVRLLRAIQAAGHHMNAERNGYGDD